jgi:regulator of cell morphogenesis and NO signaling
MRITETTTIADIVNALPSSVRVFQRQGIDFCCGGKKPDWDGLPGTRADLSPTSQARSRPRARPSRRHATGGSEPLRAIIEHIVTTYHNPLREELLDFR